MIYRMKTTIILCAIAAVMTTGCGDKKTASKDNFKQAINTYFSTDKGCIKSGQVGREKVEIYPQGATLFGKKGEDDRRHSLEVMSILVADGLYEMSVVNETLNLKNFSKNIYAITDKGKKTFAVTKEFDTACMSYLEVDEIKNYSEPSNMVGHTISSATLNVKQKSLAPWAESVRAKKPDFLADLPKSMEGRTTLVLMNDGWTVENFQRM